MKVPYRDGENLEEDQYLLKINKYPAGVSVGFLTKLNKNGTIPVSFREWYTTSNSSLPVFLFDEYFRPGWKLKYFRHGASTNWATMIHPEGFEIDIYLSNFNDILSYSTLSNKELTGEYKWCDRRLIKKQ